MVVLSEDHRICADGTPARGTGPARAAAAGQPHPRAFAPASGRRAPARTRTRAPAPEAVVRFHGYNAHVTSNPTPKPESVADAAPFYRECPVCGYISSEHGFVDGSRPCPRCSTPGDSRRTFPAERIRRLDERIRSYQTQGDDEIVVILVMTLPRDDSRGHPRPHDGRTRRGPEAARRVIWIASARSASASARSSRTLAGEEFEEAAAELGYRDFPKRWRPMREARNAFIHDSPFDRPARASRRRDGPRTRWCCSTRRTGCSFC